MSDSSIYAVIATALAIVFGLIGIVQLVGPTFVRDAYKRWDYPQRVRLLTGAFDIAAAVMLALPALRGWGIAVAAILTFGSIIVFLSHRQYRYAVPTMALMVALVPAAVAIPRTGPVQFIVVQKQVAVEGSQGSQTMVAASDDITPSTASIE